MKGQRTNPFMTITVAAVALLLSAFCAMASTTFAQEPGVTEPAQVQESVQNAQRDILRDRIRERIENETGLEEMDRVRLRQHIGECEQLGLPDDVTAALFVEHEPLKNQIRIQERVLAMAREGLPVEPVMQKLQEGRRKGVSADALEQVSNRMEAHVRTADRIMKQAREDGIHPDSPDAEHRYTRQLAGCMWSGMDESDLDQLRERARLRLRDGTCTTEDFAAAAETASRLREMRIERARALGLAGEALQNGYTAQEMQQLRWMVMTANMHGGPRDEVLATLEQGLRSQHQMTQMIRQMQQHGWMGPADEHGGHGGMSPDNTGGSGPGGHHGSGQGGNDKGGGPGGGGNG